MAFTQNDYKEVKVTNKQDKYGRQIGYEMVLFDWKDEFVAVVRKVVKQDGEWKTFGASPKLRYFKTQKEATQYGHSDMKAKVAKLNK